MSDGHIDIAAVAVADDENRRPAISSRASINPYARLPGPTRKTSIAQSRPAGAPAKAVNVLRPLARLPMQPLSQNQGNPDLIRLPTKRTVPLPSTPAASLEEHNRLLPAKRLLSTCILYNRSGGSCRGTSGFGHPQPVVYSYAIVNKKFSNIASITATQPISRPPLRSASPHQVGAQSQHVAYRFVFTNAI